MSAIVHALKSAFALVPLEPTSIYLNNDVGCKLIVYPLLASIVVGLYGAGGVIIAEP